MLCPLVVGFPGRQKPCSVVVSKNCVLPCPCNSAASSPSSCRHSVKSAWSRFLWSLPLLRKSFISLRNQTISFAASLSCTYSASTLDKVTQSCCFADQLIVPVAVPCSSTQYPPRDRRVSLSPAQSLSLHARMYSSSSFFSSPTRPLKTSGKSSVALTYANTRFKQSTAAELGLLAYLVSCDSA